LAGAQPHAQWADGRKNFPADVAPRFLVGVNSDPMEDGSHFDYLYSAAQQAATAAWVPVPVAFAADDPAQLHAAASQH